ncbi:MAG: peptide ABC transporter substrate-binding protein [Chloroflexi bacterium]|nr:peptide ABC transporter substrate-binding protein [Chloroflexota bacterium]
MSFRDLRRSRLLLPATLAIGITALAAGWYSFTTAPAPAPRIRYVEGVVGAPQRPNPLFAREHAADEDLAALLFSGLVRIAGDGTPRPDLAEAWDVTPDGRTYSFRLRSDLYWHDGERVDSADVAFTISRVQQPGFQGAATLALRWRGVELQAPDARTVIFRLPEARADFLVQTDLGVLPEHLLSGLSVRELLESPFHRAPVGSGPYRLVELSPERALLERNPSYHLGAPAIDQIELRFFAHATALEEALVRGELDGALLEEGRHRQTAAVLERRPDLRALALPRNGFTLLYINNGRPPLDDPATRRAIAASIDRDALLALVPGATAGISPIVPHSWAHSPVSAPGPEQAAERFAAAGWLRNADGELALAGRVLSLTLITNAEPERVALAELVAGQLRAQGLELTVEPLPAFELVGARLGFHDYDLALFGWESGVDPDPYSGWHTSQIPPPGRNVASYQDSVSDRMLEGARRTLDVTERRALYAAFAERFVEQAASAVLFYPSRTHLVPSSLRGVEPGLLFRSGSRFRNVHAFYFEGAHDPPGGDAGR